MYNISYLKHQTIIGRSIDLLPYDLNHIDEIIHLRNQHAAKYFLAQHYDLTYEQQKNWIEGYLLNDRELGYIVKNKRGYTVGTLFLYNATDKKIELGRAVYDLDKKAGGPYVVESLLQILAIAFEQLGFEEVVANVKNDNLSLISLLKKFGFVYVGHTEIRGASYQQLSLAGGNHDFSYMN